MRVSAPPALWLAHLLAAIGLALAPAAAQAQADAGVPAPSPSSPAGAQASAGDDAKLLEEIERAGGTPSSSAPAAATAPASPGAPAAPAPARGSNAFSNLFIPALSANGLLLGTATNGAVAPATARAGIAIQEVELQFLSHVDPYFSANLTLSLPGGKDLEVEEGILAATQQPLGIAIRAGKIREPFGRENHQHTHALSFIDRSLVNTAVFGEEGLSEVGVEGSFLMPFPWYSLLTLAVMDGANEALFASPHGRDLAGLAAVSNVVDLTDDATLELGLSYTAGKDLDLKVAQAAGAHLVWKWRPARDATNSSASIVLEGILARRPSSPERLDAPPADTAGFYGTAQWQLTRGWFVAGRFEYLNHPDVEASVALRQSAILAFAPTEFSAFRLQVSATEPPGAAATVFEAFLQANFTIGAHPAHAY